MGKHLDAYKRMEKAVDDFIDGLTDVATQAVPDDIDADITYVDEVTGVDSQEFYDILNALDDVAKKADSGELARMIRKEYGDE